ncbi:MAG: hypothetical protein ABH886_06070 [Candidatus Desantisbacteria bacterium]
MDKIFIILVILLTHLSLCYGENIDDDKLELSPQYEDGTSTGDSGQGAEASTESSASGSPTLSTADCQLPTASPVGSPTLLSQPSEAATTTIPQKESPPVQSQAESAQFMPVATITTTEGTTTPYPLRQQGIAPGTESSTVGSPTLPTANCQLPTATTVGSPTTLSSQPSEATTTTTPQVDDVPPSRILCAIKSWMIAFSGEPIITGSPSTTGLMLIPTAYRLDKQRKLNIDFLFTYYIGEFWNKTTYEESKYEKIEIFNPINRLSCSGDFKYNLIPEKKWIPAVAFGCHSFIVLQGKASNAGQMGGAVSNQSDSFSYTYGILSKSFKNIGFHIGNQYGPIGKLINPISNKLNVTSDKAFIAGLNTTICNRMAFVEIIYPQKKECIMINTFIDKFLPFNFTYIKFNNKIANDTLNGYSVSGYFRIRIPAFPGEKKEKKK